MVIPRHLLLARVAGAVAGNRKRRFDQGDGDCAMSMLVNSKAIGMTLCECVMPLAAMDFNIATVIPASQN